MLQIRAEKRPDAPGIRAVHLAAFSPRLNEADLVDILRQAGQATVSLVAVSDGRLVGHGLFSPLTLVPARADLRGLGLGPLAVTPEFQGRGIGTQLAQRGLSICREAAFDFAVVLGEPRLYRRFGFRPGRDFSLQNEYRADEAFMAMELLPGVLAGVAGLVQYRPEFKASGA